MKEEIQSKLTRLREEFIANLPARINSLQAALDALARGEAGALASLQLAAHNLVGTAGTHRLTHISDAARVLEKTAADLLPDAEMNDANLHALRAALTNLGAQAANPLYNLVPAPMKRVTASRIVVVEDDADQASWLRTTLEEAGYRVDVFDELAAFRAALQTRELPAAIIMDMAFPEGADAGARVIAEMRTQSLLVVPVIFLSVRQDMASKLAAHRAGATRYLGKPVARETLLRVIADSIALTPTKPYRVLMVDDQKSQLAANSAILQQAGMEVCTSDNPLHVIDLLDTFAAEVLLLDMHMPECSGPELAALLRDDERHAGIPIVYLSAETDIARQLLALDRGGDHFLTKPVNPAHLVSVIGTHARRFRQASEQSAALREKNYALLRQRQALDMHAIVSEADAAGNIISVNDKFCEVSGYARNELLGNNHRIVKSGEHPAEFYAEIWRTISGGKIWHGEVCNRARGGRLYWVETSIVPFMGEDGKPYQYISIRTDVTAIKQAEEKSRHDQALLRSVIAAIPDPIYFKDGAGNYLGCNEAFEHYLGLPEAQLAGKSDFDFVDEQTANALRAQDKRLFASGTSQKKEEWIAYPDGRKVLMETTRTPYWYGTKDFGVIGVLHDITEREQRLQALRESEQRWAFAIEGAGDGVWDWDMRSGEMLLSRLYERMLGYDEGELPQTIEAWVQSVHPDDLARVQQDLQDYLSDRSPSYRVELRLQCKDGGYKWVLCRGTVVARDTDGKPTRMIGIHSDIDERKRAELQLALFAEMVANTAEPIFLIDVDAGYRLAYVNQAACAHWGASKEELLTWRIPDWDPTFDEQRTSAHFAESVGKPGMLLETQHRLKDGRTVPVEVFINARMIAGRPYIYGSFQNIEMRKREEAALAAAKEAAEGANRAKSEFLSSMSHELRTPMNAILGFTQLMEGDASTTPDQRENLHQISKAGWHLLDLINEVLDLARVESGEVKLVLESVQPSAIVAECLSLVSPLVAQKQIGIENRVGEAAPRIYADYMRLKQVLINLLSNAIKYNREGGAVTLEALPKDDVLVLAVRDTGLGMTAEQLQHLFEPFTRFGDTERVQGTGIGLSICKKLIEKMNGKIRVESVPGEGSVFSIVLPLGEAAAEGAGRDVPSETASLSLLYVEDDAAQQSLLGKWAGKKGWRVDFAHDAASGIDAAMKCRYDAILLDIDLPGGFSGLDVKAVFDDMESLRVIPVIGISNLVQERDVERAMQAGFAAYLNKPVDLAELDRVLHRTIREGAKK